MPVIFKNMKSHQSRNAKTTLMYTLCIGFLIFSGTGFNLQAKMIQDLVKKTLGSDLVIFSTSSNGLDEYRIRKFLNNYKNQESFVKDFTFLTFELD